MRNSHPIAVGFALFLGFAIILSVPILMRFGKTFVDLDSPTRISTATDSDGMGANLRLSVATIWSPQETFIRYRRLGEKLGQLLGVKQTMVIRSSYREVREALEAEMIDVAIVCTGTLINLDKEQSVEILVKPEFMEGYEFRGDVIVSAASSVQSLLDLRGTTIALTDPESLTGCIVPCFRLLERGQDPAGFFGRAIFTGSHDRAIEAVASGYVDAAAVNELVYTAMCRERPRIREKTRILWQSEEFGTPPVLVPGHLPDALKNTLREAFLTMHENDEGYAILRDLGIKKFVLAGENDYATAMAVLIRVRESGGCPWP
jgi:phosphonate transport system substrate-binding protein